MKPAQRREVADRLNAIIMSLDALASEEDRAAFYRLAGAWVEFVTAPAKREIAGRFLELHDEMAQLPASVEKEIRRYAVKKFRKSAGK